MGRKENAEKARKILDAASEEEQETQAHEEEQEHQEEEQEKLLTQEELMKYRLRLIIGQIRYANREVKKGGR